MSIQKLLVMFPVNSTGITLQRAIEIFGNYLPGVKPLVVVLHHFGCTRGLFLRTPLDLYTQFSGSDKLNT